MHFAQTMAVEISEDTYPIAVACLAPSFARMSFDRAMGCYLVINEVMTHSPKKGESVLIISNSLYPNDLFKTNYRFTGKELAANFSPVKRIN